MPPSSSHDCRAETQPCPDCGRPVTYLRIYGVTRADQVRRAIEPYPITITDTGDHLLVEAVPHRCGRPTPERRELDQWGGN